MSFRTIVCALLVSAGVLVAQSPATSLPNLLICDDRNGQTDVTEGTFQVNTGQPNGQGAVFEVGIRYTPSNTITVEGIEIVLGSTFLGPIGLPVFGVFQIYSEDPATGLPGTSIATGDGGTVQGPFLPNGTAWTGSTFSQGPVLNSGTPYWITFTDLVGLGLQLGTQNITGPDITSVATRAPAGAGGNVWSAAIIQERAKLRLLSTQCPAPSNASIATVGSGCPAGNAPTLITSGLPITGNANFAFLINGGLPNLPAALFWAPTADPVGTPVASMGCRLHLDLMGTMLLINAGLNPIQVGQTGLSGFANFPFPIPSLPQLDGFSAAFQGVLVDPAGAPTGTPGVSIRLTPAVVATIGL